MNTQNDEPTTGELLALGALLGAVASIAGCMLYNVFKRGSQPNLNKLHKYSVDKLFKLRTKLETTGQYEAAAKVNDYLTAKTMTDIRITDLCK